MLNSIWWNIGSRLQEFKSPMIFEMKENYIRSYNIICRNNIIYTCIYSVHTKSVLSIYTCIYTCTYTRIYTSIHTYIRTYVRTYLHPSIHPSIHTDGRTYVHTLHYAILHNTFAVEHEWTPETGSPKSLNHVCFSTFCPPLRLLTRFTRKTSKVLCVVDWIC